MLKSERPLNIGAIVLCRLDSRRLPGKTLLPVAGRPLIWYPISRCLQVPELGRPGQIVIATSDRPVDNPIDEYARSLGLPIFRGPVDDVAQRVLLAAAEYGFDYFIRINGDSPFIDTRLLAAGIAQVRDVTPDLVTNLCPRSYPYGVSLEIVRTETYRDSYVRMSDAGHYEHVSTYLYQHIDEYRFVNLSYEHGNWHHIRLTVDTEDDLRRFRDFISKAGEGFLQMSTADVIRHYARFAELI